mmetsp:Transcript_30424/g.71112  ORF Transcript_30424/g.71112 Transcript_30424/m.71112 type:complete len:237 (-) Transcript_30424:9-719(-)
MRRGVGSIKRFGRKSLRNGLLLTLQKQERGETKAQDKTGRARIIGNGPQLSFQNTQNNRRNARQQTKLGTGPSMVLMVKSTHTHTTRHETQNGTVRNEFIGFIPPHAGNKQTNSTTHLGLLDFATVRGTQQVIAQGDGIERKGGHHVQGWKTNDVNGHELRPPRSVDRMILVPMQIGRLFHRHAKGRTQAQAQQRIGQRAKQGRRGKNGFQFALVGHGVRQAGHGMMKNLRKNDNG